MSNFNIDINKVNAAGSSMDGISGVLKQVGNEVGSIGNHLSISDESAVYIKNALNKIQESISGEAAGTKSVADALREAARLYVQTDNLLAGITTDSSTDLVNNFRDIMNRIIEWIYQLLETIGIVPGGTNEDNTYVGDPVNTCTGNYVSDILELRFSGTPALEFIRHYNSLYLQEGPMGSGWTHNYEISLRQGEGVLDLAMGNQWRERFSFTEEGVYLSRHNPQSFISVEDVSGQPDDVDSSSGNRYKYIYFQNKEKTFYFDETGKVAEISARNGKRLFFSYQDGKLVRVQDSLGRALCYEYDESGHLVHVADQIGREVHLAYDQGQNLSSVISADGRKKIYAYDGFGRLESIVNNAGTMVIWNAYDEDNRVTSQRMPDGTTMSYTYVDDKVCVTDRNGAVTEYCHNERYQITDIIRTDGQKTYSYDEKYRRVSVRTAVGSIYSMKYDEKGNIAVLTDPMGCSVEMSYQDQGLVSSIREKDGGVSKMEYDEEGNRVRYEDALGNVTVYEYKNGLITRIIHPDQTDESYEYDDHENLVSRTDAAGRRAEYEYDEADRLIRKTNAKGLSFSRTYDACGRILTVTNPLGLVKTYSYSETGRISSIKDYDGTVKEWIYNEMDLVSAYINQNGVITAYTYDANDNLASVSLPNGGKISFKYDGYNRCISKVDELGLETGYEYDPEGRLIREKTGEFEKIYKYDLCGRLLEIKEKDGGISSVERDAMGRVTAVTGPDGTRTVYKYDLLGRCVNRTDAAGSETTYSYDSCGHLTAIVRDGVQLRSYSWYPDGKIKEAVASDGTSFFYLYDEAGNLVQKETGMGYSLYYEYDALGRRTAVRDSSGRQAEYSYDYAGRISEFVDARGYATKYAYSPTGNLICTEDALNNKAFYEYDDMGLLTAVSSGEGADLRTTSFERNLKGQITCIEDAVGNRNRYEYNEFGQMILHETPESQLTRYEYDAVGRTSNILYGDGRNVSMSYDKAGRMTAMKDWDGEMEIEYDPMGRALRVQDTGGNTLLYSYDKAGHRTSIQYPDGEKAVFVSDKAGMPSEIRTSSGCIRYTYGKNGLISSKESNGARAEYEYLADGRVSRISYYDAMGKESWIELAYNECGNISEKKSWTREDNNTVIYAYEYDALSRITSVYQNGEPVRIYSYDAFGNRIYTKLNNREIRSFFNSLNQLVKQTIAEEGKETREISWCFNKDGNTISRTEGNDRTEMTYDSAGKILEVFGKEGNRTVYRYDGLGMRRSREKISGGISLSEKYTYDFADAHSPMVFSKGPEGSSNYIWDGQITGALRNGELNVYQCDQQGSVLRFLSQDGKVLEKYGFDEYGEDLTGTAGRLQPFGFTGLVFDQAAGGWNTSARTYIPGLGRFLQKDQEKYIHTENPQSINLYTYCLNNPILYVDPDGNDCYYFYLPEWENEALHDQQLLAEQYGYGLDQVHLIPVTNVDELTQGWNSMGTENGQAVDIDTVVINSHANPEVLGFGHSGSGQFSTNDAMNLNNQSMDQLILYGCNAGHRDYSGTNIASAFSQRTNGAPVMASDGTVYGMNSDGTYNPRADDEFRYWAENAGNGDRSNEGWQIYQQVDGETVVTSTGLYSITVVQMLDALRSMNVKDQAE